MRFQSINEQYYSKKKNRTVLDSLAKTLWGRKGLEIEKNECPSLPSRHCQEVHMRMCIKVRHCQADKRASMRCVTVRELFDMQGRLGGHRSDRFAEIAEI